MLLTSALIPLTALLPIIGSECDINLPIPFPSLGKYGYFMDGDQTHNNEVTFRFAGVSGDLAVAYKGYDVDSGDEVEIFINGISIGYAQTTGDNAWSPLYEHLVLPDAYVNDDDDNFLTFDNTRVPGAAETWGVSMGGACDGDCKQKLIFMPEPKAQEYGAYGYINGGDQTRPAEVNYRFNGVAGDVVVAFQGYDVDSGDEVEIFINGLSRGFRSCQSGEGAWSRVCTVELPDEYVFDSLTNMLHFRHATDPSGPWGVKNFYSGEELKLSGKWPTEGGSQSRAHRKDDSHLNISDDPELLWERTLPNDRWGTYFSNASMGPADQTYIPFFGRGWNSGGVQAVDSEGNLKWYCKGWNTEAQTPLVAERKRGGETTVIFGDTRSLIALYDRDPDDPVESCRCCVEVPADANEASQYDYCDFTCLEGEAAGYCEQDPDPLDDITYEYRHKLYAPLEGGRCTRDDWNEACALFHFDLDEIPGVPYPNPPGNPYREDPNPDPGYNDDYYEVAANPILSKDGGTVYFFANWISVGPSRGNLIVAVDVYKKEPKWWLYEDDEHGWFGESCPVWGLFDVGLRWFTGNNVLLSDGSIVFGTAQGCLVRLVDYGDHGRTEGVYLHGMDPFWNAPTGAAVQGISTEETESGDDAIYVGTQCFGGNCANNAGYGFLFKTTRERLKNDQGVEWDLNVSDFCDPNWTPGPGHSMVVGDPPGMLGSPALAEVGGTRYLFASVTDVYGVVGEDWDHGTTINRPNNPDRGWMLRIPVDGPGESPGYEEVEILEMQEGGTWYPPWNCTIDGNGDLWVQGGLNRTPDGVTGPENVNTIGNGRVFRIGPDLEGLDSIDLFPLDAGRQDPVRYGYPEILLGPTYILATASAAWQPRGEDPSCPPEQSCEVRPMDFWYEFQPVVYKYKLGDPLP